MRVVLTALALTCSVAAAAPRAPDRTPPAAASELPQLPPEQKPRYALFRSKCTSCHSASRGLESRLSDADWARHVSKLALRPSYALTDEEAKSIREFLKYVAARRARR